MPRAAALLVTLLATLLVPACARRGVPSHHGVAEPIGRDFFDAPDRYQNRVVRLVGLQAQRIDIQRPLVFTAVGDRASEVVVNDGRSLARSRSLRAGEVVTILIDCTEGRTDRGNLLLAVETSTGTGNGNGTSSPTP